MSTAAVSSSSIFQELQSFYQNRQSDLKQLGGALQSGDLNGAQQAFNALAALGQDGPFANSEPFSKSNRAQAFEAVGQALQAGDLAGAQAAFATLKVGQGSSPQAAPAAFVTLSSTQASAPVANDSASSIYQQLRAFRQQRQADLAQLGQALQSGDLAGAQAAFDNLTALGQSGPNKNGQLFERAGRAQDFQAIGQALQSGDLAGAQSAFSTLESALGKQGSQNQQAQTAISAYNPGALEIVINFIAPPASTGGVSATQPPVPEPPLLQPPATGTTATGSVPLGAPELVINLGSASGAKASGGSTTPEVVVNIGNGSSSASPEEVQINFGSGSSGASVSIGAPQEQNGSLAEQVTINLNQQSTHNYELILNLLNSTSVAQTHTSSNALSVSA
jgi:hypothetical protein